MADLKISEMTPAAELTGAELIECVQGGVNVKQELTGLKTWVNDGVQPFSSTLDALSSFNTNGIMVQTDTSEFIGRTITGTASQVTVTNGDGVSGNPTISLAASGVTAGTYGSSSAIPVPVIDTYGRITGITTAAVVSPTVFSDSVLRIQDNSDATKQIAFEASPITSGATRTITVPDANVDLSLVGNSPPAYTASVVYAVGQLVTHLGHVWSITVAHTGAIPFVNGNLELEGAVFNAGAVSTPYTVPKLGTATNPIHNKEVRIIGIGATFSLNVANAPFITRWSTTNGFNVTQLTVTAAGATFYTDSSSTSVGTGSFVVLVPGGSEVVIVRYATEVLVKVISLNSVDRFKLIDAGTNGTANLGWNFSGNATANRTITLPNADVNLGTLPSVATTDSNVLSGTRNRILGGSSNTVSGTDNVIVMGTSNTLNTSEVVVEGADWYNTTLFPLPRQTVKSSKASDTMSKRVIRSTVCLTSGSDGIGKYATVDGTQTLTSSYLPKAVAYDATKIRRATHKITAMVHSNGNVEGGFFERIVRVTQLNAGSTAITASKIVVTDTDDFGYGYNYGLTITLSASVGDALLKIVGTCTSTPGITPNNCSVSCVVESIYHIDS